MSVLFDMAELPCLSFQELEEKQYESKAVAAIEDYTSALAEITREMEVSYNERLHDILSNARYTNYNITDDIDSNIALHKLIEKHLGTLNNINLDNIELPYNIAEAYVAAYRRHRMEPFEEGIRERKKAITDKANDIRQKHEDNIRSLELDRRDLIDTLRQQHNETFDKLEEIGSLFTDIEYLEQVYKVEHDLFEIDIEKMDLAELDRVIHGAHLAVKVTKAKNPLTNAAYLLYLPAEFIINLPYIEVYYLPALLVALTLGSPYLLGSMGILFFVNITANIFKVYENRTLLRLAYSVHLSSRDMMIQAENLMYMKPEVLALTSEVKKLEVFPLEKYIQDQIKPLEEELEEYLKTTPEEEVNRYAEDVLGEDTREVYATRLSAIKSRAQLELNDAIKKLEGLEASVWKWICDYSTTVKRFGENIENTLVLKPALSVHERIYKNMTVGYHSHDIPFSNMLFKYSGKDNRRAVVDLMKLYLVNAWSRVREGSLSVTFFDPNYLGSEVAEFMDTELEKVVKLECEEFDTVFAKYGAIVRDNTFKMRTDDITKYNTMCVETGRLAVRYQLLIVLSHEGKLEEKKDFLSFLDYSTQRGVWVWVVEEEPKFTMPMVVAKPGEYVHNNVTMTYETNIEYSVPLGKRMADTMSEMLVNSRVDALDFETAYRQKVIPDDKIWTYDTISGIKLCFGFVDGDPSKPRMEILGDNAVHAIMAGQTGAGKSATINFAIACLLYMYPPEWLELVMIDFKRVEFQMYTGDLLIPHARVISGTKDGEYALSIFNFVLDEMKKRQKHIGKFKFQKIEDYNLAIKTGRLKGQKVIPRMLIIFDEFQAMFVAVGDEELEKIKLAIMAISKEARALGIHIWFTSQSMAGTMSEDILEQFKLRFGLSLASEATSNEVIGNPAAYTDLSGKGWGIANVDGGKQSKNKVYRIPYISNDEIKRYLPNLIKRAEDNGHIHHHAEFFDEAEMFDFKRMHRYYEVYPTDTVEDENMYLIGERLAFDLNGLPVHIRLNAEDGANIMYAYFDRLDGCNIVKTILENTVYKKNTVIFGTAADPEIKALTGFKDYVFAPVKNWISADNVNDVLKALGEELAIRLERGYNAATDKKIIWFIIGMDKLAGLTTDEENYDMTDVFKYILRKGPANGIHTIAGGRNPMTYRYLYNLCDYHLASKTTDMYSDAIVDSNKASKIVEKTCLLNIGTDNIKFKLYQGEYDDTLVQKKQAIVGRKVM